MCSLKRDSLEWLRLYFGQPPELYASKEIQEVGSNFKLFEEGPIGPLKTHLAQVPRMPRDACLCQLNV